MRRRAAYPATVVAALAALATCALLAGGCSDAAYTVNGVEIDRASLEREVGRRIELAEKKNPDELEGEAGERFRAATERQVATDAIRAELMEQQAARLGVKLSEQEVSKRLEQERSTVGFDQFDSKLRSQGLTEKEYEGQIARQVLVAELGAKISGDPTATDDEAESYYLTHKDQFTRSRMVRLAQIKVDTEGQADMLLEQLERGEDFAALAKAASRDTTTRLNGGEIGWVQPGALDPAAETAAFSLKTGQVSEVVKASDGKSYYILKVLESKDAYSPPFSDVKGQAMQALINSKKEEKFRDWLRTVYANAEVEVGTGTGRWDPRLGMMVEGGGGD